MNRIVKLFTLSLLSLCATANPLHADVQCINEMLEPYLASHQLPALAVAVVDQGKVIRGGVVGTRQMGQDIPVTIHDRFHIGSDTKAMTALLAAMMVDEGKLEWSSTLAEVFPELQDQMAEDVQGVTLEQLLSHTSGMPGDNEDFMILLEQAYQQDGNLDEMRYWMVAQWTQKPLVAEPSTTFAYSNMGYVIAGAMIERVSNTTWDQLISERIFDTFGFENAGLGPQASLGRIDAPLGHAVVNGEIVSFLSGPNADNPIVIGPAGIAHMSILDFAKWAGWHAGEGKRSPELVCPETFKKLHTPVIEMAPRRNAAPGTPPGGAYGLGMGLMPVDWAPYPLLYHGGSNNMNLAHIWIDPKQDVAMVLITNIGGVKANEALLEIAAQLYQEVTASRE